MLTDESSSCSTSGTDGRPARAAGPDQRRGGDQRLAERETGRRLLASPTSRARRPGRRRSSAGSGDRLLRRRRVRRAAGGRGHDAARVRATARALPPPPSTDILAPGRRRRSASRTNRSNASSVPGGIFGEYYGGAEGEEDVRRQPLVGPGRYLRLSRARGGHAVLSHHHLSPGNPAPRTLCPANRTREPPACRTHACVWLVCDVPAKLRQ